MEDMISKLKKPRRVMLLVKAGAAVDAFIEKLVINFLYTNQIAILLARPCIFV